MLNVILLVTLLRPSPCGWYDVVRIRSTPAILHVAFPDVGSKTFVAVGCDLVGEAKSFYPVIEEAASGYGGGVGSFCFDEYCKPR